MPEIMNMHNRLLEEDIRRSGEIDATSEMVAKSYYCGIKACELFAKKFINPVLATQLSLSDREKVILRHYHRIIMYCQSLLVLNNPIHFQSVASAARSILELYIDMEILSKNLFSDGIMRVTAFVEAQKLKAARKTLQFFSNNPEMLQSKSVIEPQCQYVNSGETRIDAQTQAFWGIDKNGKSKTPEHWTEWDLKSRSVKLGKQFELLVNDGYDHRNFLIHTGMTGVSGLNQKDYTILCALSYRTIHECLLGAFMVVVAELKITAALEPFSDHMDQLRHIPGWVLADEKLKSLGEPGRFFIEVQE